MKNKYFCGLVSFKTAWQVTIITNKYGKLSWQLKLEYEKNDDYYKGKMTIAFPKTSENQWYKNDYK